LAEKREREKHMEDLRKAAEKIWSRKMRCLNSSSDEAEMLRKLEDDSDDASSGGGEEPEDGDPYKHMVFLHEGT